MIAAIPRPTRAPNLVKKPMKNVIIPTSNAGTKITLPIRIASPFLNSIGDSK